MGNSTRIKTPPKGIAIFALLGPGLVWTSEVVGSGEVILTTRNGAIFGIAILWAILVGIFLKSWIGISGARYTVCTGESMIDMFSRIPGPRNWVVWMVMLIQLISAMVAMGSLASASGAFLQNLIPVPSQIAGWIISFITVVIIWSGRFNILKMVMSFMVALMCIGIIYVAVIVFPTFSEFVNGFMFNIPEVPEWAVSTAGISKNPWREILPLIGWAAGGFASQVWYTYWILGEGYGMAHGRGYGKPADLDALRSISKQDAQKIRGWNRVVYTDASVAILITTVFTVCFLIAGAGILRPCELAPQGPDVAITLSTIFSSQWGRLGGYLFMLSGTAALCGTLMAQMAGWPRLIADTFRICIPGFNKMFRWETQYRIFLVLFFITNMLIVFVFGLQPVFLVRTSAVLDGLLLTPLQAIWVAVGLYIIMPKLFPGEIYKIIRPHWIFAVILIIAFIVFGYFCIFQIPFII